MGGALALLFGGAVMGQPAEKPLLPSMTVTEAELDLANRPFVFDGTVRGNMAQYFNGRTDGTRSMIVGQFQLAPGSEPHPIHTHADDEFLIVTAGEGEVECAGRTTPVTAGSVMYAAPKIPHGIKNTGDAPLTFYFVKWIANPVSYAETSLLSERPSYARVPPNTLSAQERSQGWRLLWDGRTREGWRGAKQDAFPTDAWQMENGELSVMSVAPGAAWRGGDIVTRERFTDFELSVDFRLSPGANSGIKYFVEAGPRPGGASSLGLEYQLIDDERHPDATEGRDGNRRLAAVYDLYPAAATKPAKPPGEWNTARVVARGPRVEHWLNEVKVAAYERTNEAFRGEVKRSKYAALPGFGEGRDGHILLQDHGDAVSFRNIKIRSLPAGSPGYRFAHPDLVRSPHTGLTREHWKACGRHLLERMFAGIPSMESPLVFLKSPGKSYPRPEQPPLRFRAAEQEGLARSLNLAAPLMQEDPGLAVRGMRLLDYYRRELVALTTPGGPRALPLLSSLDMAERENWQMTVELSGLSANLLLHPRLWESLSKPEQDNLAAYLSDYAHGRTAAHNWRWFNVMMMLFLKHRGYPVDEAVWSSHLDALVALDAGEGWFRDAHFDFYNAWTFQLYAPIWCRFYGYEHAPEMAALMERQAREFLATYPLMFSRNGFMPMWGRSIMYRSAAVAPLPAAFLFRQPPALDPGWARRIASGNLLQFVTRDDFMENGVPSLGFYGPFEPSVQGYSCAASPMWGHLNYLTALSLPAEHPFWTAVENEGSWPALGAATRDTPLNLPGILVANYGRSGHSEVRTGKAEPDDPNYNRLAYHTAFPWEELDPAAGMAMHYTRQTNDPIEGKGFRMPVKVFWGGYRDGVLYRQLQTHRFINGNHSVIDLADITLPLGVLRVDRPRLILSGKLRLSHFGLPSIGGRPAEIERRTVAGHPVIIARIPGRQVALVALAGWDRVDAVVHRGFNPEAEESTVLFAEWTHAERLPSLQPRIALLLHKCDDSPWTDEDLLPVASWESPRVSELGIHGTRVRLKDGRSFAITYEHIEGLRQD